MECFVKFFFFFDRQCFVKFCLNATVLLVLFSHYEALKTKMEKISPFTKIEGWGLSEI